MKTIYKYPLEITDKQDIHIPVGSQFLDIHNQNEQLVVYYLVDSEVKQKYTSTIHIYGTGHEIKNSTQLCYLKSVSTYSGSLVWHIFQEKI